tara:strand:- start:228 stop:926 length:699 start_codon:yes stop_codon:yes gene_type:complete
MSGTFPDTTKFKSVVIRSDANQKTSIDANNKFYSLLQDLAETDYNMPGLRHAWEFELETVPMTRSDMGPIYSFLLDQYGSAETFTIKPPTTAHQYTTDTSSDRTFIQSTALLKGDVGIIFQIESSENSQNYSDDAGLTFLKTGDFIKYANHDKVYMWKSGDFSVPCANFVHSLVTQNGYIWPPCQEDVPGNTNLSWDPEFKVALIDEPLAVQTDIDGLFKLKFNVREEYNAS